MAEPVTEVVPEITPHREPDPDVGVIVNFLAALRKAYGLSQWEVGIRSGTSQSYVSETETGATPNPRSDLLATLCRSYGVQLTVQLDPNISPEDAAKAIVVARKMNAELGVRIAVAHS